MEIRALGHKKNKRGRRLGTALAGAAAWLLMAVPFTANAQAEAAAKMIDIRAFWLATIIAVVALFLAIRLGLRQRLAKIRSSESDAILKYSDAVLDLGPGSFITVHPNGTCYCSSRFRNWLGITNSIASLQEIENAAQDLSFDHQALAKVMTQISNLSEDGVPFIAACHFQKNDGLYLVTGSRLETKSQKDRAFSVVWFCPLAGLGASMAEQAVPYLDEHHLASSLLDNAPFPVWIRNQALNIAWVNRAYLEIVEQDNLESVIDHQIELAGSTHKDAQHSNARDALSSGAALSQKFFVVTGGERKSLAITEAPLDKNLGNTIGFAIDITREEFMEAELQQHKSSHAKTLDMMSTPVAIFGPDQSLRFYNKAFAELWQLKEKWLDSEPKHGELLEELRERCQVPEQADFPSWKRDIINYYTDLLEPAEETWYLPSGKTIRVVTQPHPLGGLLVIFEDVTDKLALERSYNTLIDVQRETLENLYEAVTVVGADGRIKLFNAAYCGLWGLDKDMLSGQPHIGEVLDICAPQFTKTAKDWPPLREQILSFAISRAQHSGEWHLTNGSVLEYSVVPLPDGAALFSIIDQTAKANIENALNDKNNALEAADKLKSEFVASMSYELRTPLNSIIGFSELLASGSAGVLAGKQSEYVDATLQSSYKLRELIENILDMAIIEAGKMAIESKPYDMNEVVSDIAKLTAVNAQSKSVSLVINCDNQLGNVSGDSRRIKQAVYNLIMDSLARAGREGRVQLDITGSSNEVLLRLEHSGASRALHGAGDSGLSGTPTPGAGLGLSLVHSFFELHGGTVTTEDKKNGARIITCHLPRTVSAVITAEVGE